MTDWHQYSEDKKMDVTEWTTSQLAGLLSVISCPNEAILKFSVPPTVV